MTKKMLCATVAGLTGLISLHAQTEHTLTLPKMERTAQSAALGEGGAYLLGLNALGVNPAGLGTAAPEILTQYQSMPLDTNLALAAAAVPVSSIKTTFALSYLGLRSTQFDKRNEYGDRTGQFSTQDQIYGLHASRPVQLLSGIRPLALGFSLKLIQSKMDSYQGKAWALDLGSRSSFKSLPFSWSAALLNMGQGPVFQKERSQLPTQGVVAGAYHLNSHFAVTGGVKHNFHEKNQEVSLGAEYQLGNTLSLRGRYALGNGGVSQPVGLENLTGGIGVNLLQQYALDYAFQPFNRALKEAGAGGTHKMTLTYRFKNNGNGGK